ncbi:MAG: glycoside hydrolase family 127 protein [Paludibacter sp.]|nr:glycoside hydrolase family 127 protein [Paludibacter sp.]
MLHFYSKEKYSLIGYNYQFLIVLIMVIFVVKINAQSKKSIKPISIIALSNLQTGGELATRIHKNFDRIESERYQPNKVFLTDEQSGNWPGDTEGRTILGLVMNAQASHREPKYLQQIIDLIPSHLNSKGYMGKIQPDGYMDEQQLSGNGWMLRGLCEYYNWKKDPQALSIIKSISQNLFVAGKGKYSKYPVENNSRKMNGAVIGSIQEKRDGWILSTDVGCVFIGMAGAIQAYQTIGGDDLKAVVQEMVDKFMPVDPVGLKMQTHAYLTGLTGIARYYEISKDKKYLDMLQKSWVIYKQYGMTENFENYNWFTIYDAWTESCGVIDSYILASKLWQYTLNPMYLAEMDLIYYNAISHAQRANGGFGCDNCPSAKVNSLKVIINEAWWCCTMRGGEGLSRVAENSYFVSNDTLFVTRYCENNAKFYFKNNSHLNLTQTTQYPFSNKITFNVSNVQNAKNVVVKLNALSDWTENFKIKINNHEVKAAKSNGFYLLSKNWKNNDKIELSFDQIVRLEPIMNTLNGNKLDKRLFKGPLIWGVAGDSTVILSDISKIKQINPMKLFVGKQKSEFTPLYHLLDSTVVEKSYQKQFLFRESDCNSVKNLVIKQ